MYLRKSDRDAAVLFIGIIVLVIVLFPMVGRNNSELREAPVIGRVANRTQSYARTARALAGQEHQLERKNANQLFPFDPNTADSTTFLKLGLKRWQVRNIYKYRAKGGRYRQKEDFAMLYGLTLEHYRRLEPYIQIAPEVMARDVIKAEKRQFTIHNSQFTVQTSNLKSQTSKLRQGETIDINTADTTQLKRIPGIGSYFARRIVELRQRRQAFSSPEDLLSIRNFPETALVYMTASQSFDKIHINHLTLQQLKAHPLLNHTQATDILRYRRLNGNIHSATDLSTLPSFTEQHLARLTPYLLFD